MFKVLKATGLALAISFALPVAHADDSQFVGAWRCIFGDHREFRTDFAMFDNGIFVSRMYAPQGLVGYDGGKWASGPTQIIFRHLAQRWDTPKHSGRWEPLEQLPDVKQGGALSFWYQWHDLTPTGFNMVAISNSNWDMSSIESVSGVATQWCVRDSSLLPALRRIAAD